MSVEILGVRIDNLSFNEAVKKAEFFLTETKGHFIVTPNPEMVVVAQKDRFFRNVLNAADMAIPDGVGLVLASKFLKNHINEKIAGVDFMEKICEMAVRNKKSVFLLGAGNGIAQKAAENLKYKLPGIEIAGYLDGEFDIDTCYRDIQKAAPDILFVAFGAPKQEKWIFDNLKKIESVKLAMGIGGAFDFLSGKTKRAPLWMRKLWLEWLWRLIWEPKRFKRIVNAVIVFPILFVEFLIGRRL